MAGPALGRAARCRGAEQCAHGARFGFVVGAGGGAVQVDVVDRIGLELRRIAARAPSPGARPAPPGEAWTCGRRPRSRRRPAGASRQRLPPARAARSRRPRRSRCRSDRGRRAGRESRRRAPGNGSRTAWSGTRCPLRRRQRRRRGLRRWRVQRQRTPSRWRSTPWTPPPTVRADPARPARKPPARRCCACRHTRSREAAPRCAGRAAGMRARSRECRRCWCPRTHPPASAPKRWRACAAAAAKPSCCSASWARRLLRQSNRPSVRAHRRQGAVVDLADEGVQLHRLEAAGRQPGTALAQRLQRSGEPDADAAGECDVAQVERLHVVPDAAGLTAAGVTAASRWQPRQPRLAPRPAVNQSGTVG